MILCHVIDKFMPSSTPFAEVPPPYLGEATEYERVREEMRLAKPAFC